MSGQVSQAGVHGRGEVAAAASYHGVASLCNGVRLTVDAQGDEGGTVTPLLLDELDALLLCTGRTVGDDEHDTPVARVRLGVHAFPDQGGQHHGAACTCPSQRGRRGDATNLLDASQFAAETDDLGRAAEGLRRISDGPRCMQALAVLVFHAGAIVEQDRHLRVDRTVDGTTIKCRHGLA